MILESYNMKEIVDKSREGMDVVSEVHVLTRDHAYC